ncbi:hypothetical protein T484DRAFT_1794899 [Baffinella frigidus]|nr:hypothetical protein T484DRAFT_1794899 [Cryptophyta sp. CCMP2293]
MSLGQRRWLGARVLLGLALACCSAPVDGVETDFACFNCMFEPNSTTPMKLRASWSVDRGGLRKGTTAGVASVWSGAELGLAMVLTVLGPATVYLKSGGVVVVNKAAKAKPALLTILDPATVYLTSGGVNKAAKAKTSDTRGAGMRLEHAQPVYLTSGGVVVNKAAKSKATEIGMMDWNCDDPEKSLPEW